MAFLDILKGRKREEVKPERLPKGVFKPSDKSKAEVSRKKKKKEIEEPVRKEKKPAKEEMPAKTGRSDLAAKVLLSPHLSEQSNALAEKNIYTFRVSPSANKIMIKKAIWQMYGFKPLKVRIINTKPKKRRMRQIIGFKPGFKKALVYLKENEKIEFV